MSKAIQHAYYLNARNPSDDDTLISLADDIGLDCKRFATDLHSEEIRAEHQRQMHRCLQLGIQGYPSLVLAQGDTAQRVTLDHNSADATLIHLHHLLGEGSANV